MSATQLTRFQPNELVAQLASAGVKLPLRLCDEDVGVVLDDDGTDVFTVSTNGRSGIKAGLIALYIVDAVHARAGFRSGVRSDG